MHSHWLLYSYDALGLGHARRMTGIARAVLPSRPDLSALLVTCSPQIDALPVPIGLDYVKLPSARKVGPGRYEPRTLTVEHERFRGNKLDAKTGFDVEGGKGLVGCGRRNAWKLRWVHLRLSRERQDTTECDQVDQRQPQGHQPPSCERSLSHRELKVLWLLDPPNQQSSISNDQSSILWAPELMIWY